MTPPDLQQFKVPPQNIEAEQSILGAVLLDNEAIHRCLELVQAEDFYRETHRKIYEAVLDLYQKSEPVDIITLTSHLKSKNVLDQVGGATYLSFLVDQVPTAANVASYCKIVREKSVSRRLIEGATQIISDGYQQHADVNEYLDKAEQIIFDVAQNRTKKGFSQVKDVVKDSFKAIEQLYERKELITGVPSGFKDLDRLTSGFQPSDLVIIAGRPSMGKTAFVLSILENAAIDHGKYCAIFSLEMSKEQLVQRMLCSRAEIDSTKLRGGFLAESDWPKLTRAAGMISESPVFIDDTPAITSMELRAKARRLQREHGLDLVVVDYLQLMRASRRIESREREIAEISSSLKALAKELSVPVLALSQLNRGLEARQDKRPQLSDLRESGSIEQDADVVMFIYRDEVYNKETPDAGKAEIIIGKQRNGPIGRATLAFRHNITRFDNLAQHVDQSSASPSHILEGVGDVPSAEDGY
ncbi:MAG: replicative DNA helicase [Deltaproteobacteria bacterium CG11_big_fil_rev_8_21_14_0_20_42_23]|nr:MAG: replicative DNA helicase [Deltaproteobacteria bacterium CG11_big_fil_rev_8_21_14_0_20_42_23]PJC64698.1 MAG: replicative DNA helicase [Deltaproteobacteria bacterium CG_4_9_14_0_2_um_filter_42_21]